MPNIAQQDYIIIDWEGKGQNDDAKKAEVDKILKNLYLSNPLSLLSVVFKNYLSLSEGNVVYSPIIMAGCDDGVSVYLYFFYSGSSTMVDFSFDLE